MIKKVGSKWVVFSKDGKKKLGTHSSEDEAKAQIAAIEIAKHFREKYWNKK